MLNSDTEGLGNTENCWLIKLAYLIEAQAIVWALRSSNHMPPLHDAYIDITDDQLEYAWEGMASAHAALLLPIRKL